MNDIPIPPVRSAGLVQLISTSSTTQDSPEVPAALAGIPVGSVLKGFVINRDRHNNPVLRTEHGDVLVKSDVFLKTGSEVVIRLEVVASHARARIISVDNQSLKELMHTQQQSLPIDDDTVLQPSIMQSTARGASATLPPPLPSGVSPSAPPEITLQAVMVRANGSEQQLETQLTTILKVPPETAALIARGAPLTVKVVASDLNIVTQPPASTTTPSAAASTTPTLTTAPLPPASAAGYQAYGQVTAHHPFPQGVSAATPQPAPMPASLAISSPPNTLITPPVSQPALPLAPPQPSSPSAPAAPASSPLPLMPSTAPLASQNPILQGTPPLQATAPLQQAPASAASPVDVLRAAMPLPQAPVADFMPPAQRPATMTAIVIGSEAGGQTVVRTPIGVMKLLTATPPPVDSTLQLAWVPTAIAAPSPTPLTAVAEPDSVTMMNTLAQQWQSLEEAMNALKADPLQMADLAARIPNTKSKLVNEVLFFISALKAGNVRSWLGDRVSDRLEERSPGTLQRLSADFSGARSHASAPSEQPWQILSIPFRHDQQLEHLRLFIKTDDEGSAPNARSDSARFVVDLTLSQLGEMQLDGFVRHEGATMLFDLTIRSTHSLPEDMQREIGALFADGGAITGYKGTLRFQPHPELFVRPLQEAAPPPHLDDRSIIA